jgi:hypothetical protein
MAMRACTLKSLDRFYGALLWLYPAGFRARFGGEMMQIFRDCRQEEAGDRGPGAYFAFWLRTVSDLCSLPPDGVAARVPSSYSSRLRGLGVGRFTRSSHDRRRNSLGGGAHLGHSDPTRNASGQDACQLWTVEPGATDYGRHRCVYLGCPGRTERLGRSSMQSD